MQERVDTIQDRIHSIQSETREMLAVLRSIDEHISTLREAEIKHREEIKHLAIEVARIQTQQQVASGIVGGIAGALTSLVTSVTGVLHR